MRFFYFLICSLLFFCTSCQLTPEEIIIKSLNKCQSIENGYYEMSYQVKYMGNPDTVNYTYKCHFSKLPNDTIYPSAFHYQLYENGEYLKDALYTGEYLVYFITKDSLGEIQSKTIWAEKMKSTSHNNILYTPLVGKKIAPFHIELDSTDQQTITIVGVENINGFSCYHIKTEIIEGSKEEKNTFVTPLRSEYHYWIDKQDFIPIQFSTAYDLLMNNDTMHQFNKFVLSNFELNNLEDMHHLELNSVPPFINLKEYATSDKIALLATGSDAPKWNLQSIDDEIFNLEDLKGELILLDFFYKGCLPCMKAYPEIQSLHEKYKDKGLQVFGIDPIDSKDEEMKQFLKDKEIGFTTLFADKKFAKEYNVSAYPTLYLIDRQGKILFANEGYGEGTKDKLENIIKKNL